MGIKYKIALGINIADVAFGLLASIILVISGVLPGNAPFVVDLLMYAAVAYYTFKGYKKPHGNLLRYVMSFFVLMLIVRLSFWTPSGVTLYLYSLAIALTAYMAGRLNKFKQNCIISIIVLAIFVYTQHTLVGKITSAEESTSLFEEIPVYNLVTVWIAITTAYFTRFLKHKEAGLIDK